ncbi:MAG TPA: DUF3152 domain-containing protein [Pseudonocardiaceae bacterium]|nr:DUF3152 domain-containing protein [Pseudonocardiaceae bacterium]
MTKRPPGVRASSTRRTTATPLAAAWPAELEAPEHQKPEKPRKRPYTWRIYAVPLLIVVTVLVVVNTARSNDKPAAKAPPVATEHPAVPVFTGTGTAVLPTGPAVPMAGAGTWHVVPGSGPVTGTAQHVYHYQVAVEDGIDPAAYGGDDAFASDVDATLADPRGWLAAGTVAVQRVDAGFQHPDFVISLTTPDTDHRPDLCGFAIRYETSCWRPATHRVVINLARWVRGALAFDGDLGLYRQYAINHEVGHVFGNPNTGCATDAGLAPVMMQQSLGVADDYVARLDQQDPANATGVQQDGKVCRANAWPYPQGPGNPVDAPPGG